MKGKIGLAAAILALTIASVAGCASTPTTGEASARRDVLYSCDCGPECKCGAVSTQAGKCPCGKEMKWGHVVKVEGDEAILCQCAEGCTCAIDPKDPSKCGCGTATKRVSLRDTGIYFCNCGGSCMCNTVSDKPGDCRCGMKLKKAEG